MKSFFSYIKLHKRRIILGLSLLVYLSLAVALVCQTTVASYKSKIGTFSASMRIAGWSVDVTLADDETVYVVSSAIDHEIWSNTYRLDIINNSEVLACYGHDGEGEYHSLLVFDNLPSAIEKVRLISADTGEVELESNDIVDTGISIVFDGDLGMGETRTYYVQFAAGNTNENQNSTVSVSADFRFEQAFERQTVSVSVSN